MTCPFRDGISRVGSGAGVQRLTGGLFDFACSDAPYKDEDKGKIKGGDFVYVPAWVPHREENPYDIVSNVSRFRSRVP